MHDAKAKNDKNLHMIAESLTLMQQVMSTQQTQLKRLVDYIVYLQEKEKKGVTNESLRT
jgi:CRISPR/Cas system CSM-associated protein Csm2 small subunit